MSETIDRCVEAVIGSVHWLDRNKPGWASKINLDDFCFIHSTKCIAGQLHLDYFEKHSSNGFDSPLPSDHPDLDFSYSFMEGVWRTFIQKRLDHVIPQVASPDLL